MKFKPNQKCWSIEEGKIKEHTIQDIGFTSKGEQLIKIDNQWREKIGLYITLNKAMEIEEGNTFRMFR